MEFQKEKGPMANMTHRTRTASKKTGERKETSVQCSAAGHCYQTFQSSEPELQKQEMIDFDEMVFEQSLTQASVDCTDGPIG
jgi:hypothetical protein